MRKIPDLCKCLFPSYVRYIGSGREGVLVSGVENIDIANDSTETRNEKDLHFRLE